LKEPARLDDPIQSSLNLITVHHGDGLKIQEFYHFLVYFE